MELPAVSTSMALLFFYSVLLIVSFVAAQDPSFINIPASVNVTENSPIHTEVAQFGIVTADPNPKVEIVSVVPATNAFNLVFDKSLSTASITLAATLDFETQPWYTITVYVEDYNLTSVTNISANILVRVLDVNEPPQCEPQLVSPGVTVQVREDISPGTSIYVVLASDPDHNSVLQYNVSDALPSGSANRFRFLNPSPSLLNIGSFNYQKGDTNFIVSVVVEDQFGLKCTGTVHVEILPVKNTLLNFTFPVQNVTIKENIGPDIYVTKVTASSGTNLRYHLVTPSVSFWIDQGSGIIRTGMHLDVDKTPSLTYTMLLVRVYSADSSGTSGTATVNVFVLDVNDNFPVCDPPSFLVEVKETEPIGTVLTTLKCSDADITNNTLSYEIVPDGNSLDKFRLTGNNLEINDTLDYDSEEIARANFQYKASIIVTDSGVPPLSISIPIQVGVYPVNEFKPTFPGPFFFDVLENRAAHTVIGSVNGQDRDWEFNNLHYSIIGGNIPPVFYIDMKSGTIHLLGSLDFEMKRSYELNIQVVDIDQDRDPDPLKQNTVNQLFTVQVQDENDNPPVCNPPFHETTIYSTLSARDPVLTVTCTDGDINFVHTFRISGGNENNRFTMNGNQLMSRNTFSYNPAGVMDPLTFDLSIQVSDGVFITSVKVIVHVVPWTTTSPTTTTPLVTRSIKTVTVLQGYWEPEPWFVAILTISVALAIGTTALLIWKILQCTSLSNSSPPEMTAPLVQQG
ncbi:cadherin-related family member 4 [Protopterus annectens]|uniref:cadherin-related family member 4 n=1 Tax=Protopterus annectens TaxID=7888 RepID=UPI001CFA014A|nr:cadherin-related family member 4 [Protopterus annectens]